MEDALQRASRIQLESPQSRIEEKIEKGQANTHEKKYILRKRKYYSSVLRIVIQHVASESASDCLLSSLQSWERLKKIQRPNLSYIVTSNIKLQCETKSKSCYYNKSPSVVKNLNWICCCFCLILFYNLKSSAVELIENNWQVAKNWFGGGENSFLKLLDSSCWVGFWQF